MSAVSLGSIQEVRIGHQTDFFNRLQDEFDPDVCVSIVYGRSQPPDMLSFMAFTSQQAERVAAGLNKLSRGSQSKLVYLLTDVTLFLIECLRVLVYHEEMMPYNDSYLL